MDEIDLAASNDDLGQDEDSVEELSKKHMVTTRIFANTCNVSPSTCKVSLFIISPVSVRCLPL